MILTPIYLLIAVLILVCGAFLVRNLRRDRSGARPLTTAQRRWGFVWLATIMLLASLIIIPGLLQNRQAQESKRFLSTAEVTKLISNCEIEEFHRTDRGTPFGDTMVIQVVYKDKKIEWNNPKTRNYTSIENLQPMLQARANTTNCSFIEYDDTSSKGTYRWLSQNQVETRLAECKVILFAPARAYQLNEMYDQTGGVGTGVMSWHEGPDQVLLADQAQYDKILPLAQQAQQNCLGRPFIDPYSNR